MRKLYVSFLLQLCVLTASEHIEVDSPDAIKAYQRIFHWLFETFGKRQTRTFTGETGKTYEKVPENVPFPCNVTGGRSTNVPESVHRLRPGDIDVIAAIGDSLTAGTGIFASSNILEVLVNNRGVTAAGGGEGNWRTYLTLPNILKEFNPNLIGYALGDSITSDSNSQLNVAVFGALSRHTPYMARFLVNKMKNDPRIDMKKHWKFISILIGANDFCSEVCETPNPYSVLEKHKNDLINTLRILKDNIPRAFVAIISPPNLKDFVACHAKERRPMYSYCYFTTIFECPCLFALQYKERQAEYLEIIAQWQILEKEIAEYPEFHTDNFTVVQLPTFETIPQLLNEDGGCNFQYLAQDCFHISQKTNAHYANGLWNNLFEPYANKTDQFTYTLYKRFLCPTPEKPFLTTRENSRLYS